MAWIRVDQSLRDHRKLIALAGELNVSPTTAAGHLVFLWLWCLDNAPTGIIKGQASADKPKRNTRVGFTDPARKCKSNTQVAVTDPARKCKSNGQAISTNPAGKPKGNIRGVVTDPATKCIGNIRVIATACAWRRNPNDLVNALLSTGFLDKCGRGGISLRIHDWHEYMGKLLDARAAHRDRMQRARAALRNSTAQDSTAQDSREVPLQGSPKRGTGRRRRKDDGSPLSGRHRDKVKH